MAAVSGGFIIQILRAFQNRKQNTERRGNKETKIGNSVNLFLKDFKLEQNVFKIVSINYEQ